MRQHNDMPLLSPKQTPTSSRKKTKNQKIVLRADAGTKTERLSHRQEQETQPSRERESTYEPSFVPPKEGRMKKGLQKHIKQNKHI